MATDYSVRLTGQDNLTPTLKSAKQAFNDLNTGSNKLDNIRAKFQRIEQSSAPLKRKLRDLQAIMAQMNLDGLSNTDVFANIAAQAAAYKDAIGDAAQATRLLSSDTAGLDAGIQAFQGLAGAAAVATGVMGLFGVENKNVEQAILRVQSVLGILNGVQAIANVLNKDSILMLKLQQLHQLGVAAATGVATVSLKANTGATTLSTIATKAWNYVKAISKALLGDFSGLLIVGAGALITYALCTSDAKEKEEEHAEAIEKTDKAVQTYNTTLAGTFANLMSKYQELRIQWNSLKSESEQQQFLIDQKNNIDNLTDSVTNVANAEQYFNNQTQAVVKSFLERANAAAMMAQMTELYRRQIEITTNIETANQNARLTRQKKYGPYANLKAGDSFEFGDAIIGDAFRGGIKDGKNMYYDVVRGKAIITPAGEARLKQYVMEKTNVVADGPWTRAQKAEYAANEIKIKNLAQQMQQLYEDNPNLINTPKHTNKQTGSNNTRNTRQTGTSTTTQKEEKTSEQKISDLMNELDRLNKIVNNPKSGKAKIDEAKGKIEDTKLKIRQEYNTIAKDLTEKYVAGIFSPEDVQEKLGEINKILNNLNLNPIEVNLAIAKQDILNELYEEYEQMANNVKTLFERGIIDEETAKKQIDLINSELANEGLNPIEIEIIPITKLDKNREKLSKSDAMFKQMQDDFSNNLIDMNEVNKQLSIINEIRKSIGLDEIEITLDADGAIITLGELKKAQAETFNELKNNIVELTSSFGGQNVQMTNSFIHIRDMIKQVAEHWDEFTSKTQKTIAITTLAGAGIAQLGDCLQQIGGDGEIAKIGAITAAIGQIVLGFASALAQAGTLGPWGWLAFAGAGLAAVATLISTVKGFADGGIIGGNSFHGDKIVARVNAGEMILNQKQQANLFRLLDNGGSVNGGGKVEFKISGSTLKGVLRNYDNKMNKIRK